MQSRNMVLRWHTKSQYSRMEFVVGLVVLLYGSFRKKKDAILSSFVFEPIKLSIFPRTSCSLSFAQLVTLEEGTLREIVLLGENCFSFSDIVVF